MNIEEVLVIVNVVLKQAAQKQQYLSDVQALVLRQTWAGQSYSEIAQGSDYDTDYIKNVGSKLWRLLSKAFGEEVTKSNIHAVLKRHSGSVRASASQQTQEVALLASSSGEATVNKHQNWGEAIDVSVFYGRTEELATLEQWVQKERCRLVALLGMGGIGKTALSVKLAEQIEGEFDALIWQSLRNAPPIQEMLTNLLKFLSYQQETNFPATVDGKISRLLEYLHSERCLLLLDNFDALFRSGERVGKYRDANRINTKIIAGAGITATASTARNQCSWFYPTACGHGVHD